MHYITCVDEVRQWQVQACGQGIREAFLFPVLALALQELLLEQTKPRSRHSNDNALAGSKNGSEVRKHMGYGPILQKCALHNCAFH